MAKKGICGHIHQPANRIIKNSNGSVNYLNSGNWIENLTALEFENNGWKIYYYNKDKQVKELKDSLFLDEAAYLRTAELFKMMINGIFCLCKPLNPISFNIQCTARPHD